MDRTDILKKAIDIVNGQREQDYGRPENSFRTIAQLWGIYTGSDFTPQNVAMMLALVKVARIASGRHHLDNYVDLGGYASLAGELEEEVASKS